MEWSRLYRGYLETPMLWKGNLQDVEQIDLPSSLSPRIQVDPVSNKRLGAIAEQFTFDYWSSIQGLKIIQRNIQINGEKETLGELDAILEFHGKMHHVEIAYKVYLYDPDYGKTALEHWIGPNRRDDFMTKLRRIREHQLPLIEKTETKEILERLGVSTIHESKVWVKGLLFVPSENDIDVTPLNEDCIAGYYIRGNALKNHSKSKFHMPSKLEWMVSPHSNVEWRSYNHMSVQIEALHEKQFSPMIWKKEPNGLLSRMFVVWW